MVPNIDWLQEFWKSAQQASPFGAMGAVICLWIVWRRLNKALDKVEVMGQRSIEALVQVERTLDALLDRKVTRRRSHRG